MFFCDTTKTSLDNISDEKFIETLGLKVLNQKTTWYYFTIYLGFKYHTRTKTSYVYGHEDKKNIEHRIQFCKWYLKQEIFAHRRVQIARDKFDQLVHVGTIQKESLFYEYTVVKETKKIKMVELHVNEGEILLQNILPELTSMGAN